MTMEELAGACSDDDEDAEVAADDDVVFVGVIAFMLPTGDKVDAGRWISFPSATASGRDLVEPTRDM